MMEKVRHGNFALPASRTLGIEDGESGVDEARGARNAFEHGVGAEGVEVRAGEGEGKGGGDAGEGEGGVEVESVHHILAY